MERALEKKILSPLPKALFLALLTALAALHGGASFAQPLLDPDSEQCLSCHRDAAMTEGPLILVCHMGECDHPIGIDYMEAFQKKGGFRNPSLLDKAMKLTDNRIGCTTCHVPYNEYDHLMLSKKRGTDPNIPDPMLSVDNRGSGLCLQCHMK